MKRFALLCLFLGACSKAPECQRFRRPEAEACFKECWLTVMRSGRGFVAINVNWCADELCGDWYVEVCK